MRKQREGIRLESVHDLPSWIGADGQPRTIAAVQMIDQSRIDVRGGQLACVNGVDQLLPGGGSSSYPHVLLICKLALIPPEFMALLLGFQDLAKVSMLLEGVGDTGFINLLIDPVEPGRLRHGWRVRLISCGLQ